MTTLIRTHASSSVGTRRIVPVIVAMTQLPLAWVRRIRDRRQLMRLLEQPEYLLKDVGLQRDAIVREAIKRFWVA